MIILNLFLEYILIFNMLIGFSSNVRWDNKKKNLNTNDEDFDT